MLPVLSHVQAWRHNQTLVSSTKSVPGHKTAGDYDALISAAKAKLLRAAHAAKWHVVNFHGARSNDVSGSSAAGSKSDATARIQALRNIPLENSEDGSTSASGASNGTSEKNV